LVSYQKHAITLLTVGLVLWLVLGTGPVQATNETGNFIRTNSLDYYPETVYTLDLTNLTVNSYYGILIGVNQFSYDYQWLNFTAAATTASKDFIHFDTQTYLDNTSSPIQYLLIYLYNMTGDADANPYFLDSINLYLITVHDQLNPSLLATILITIILAVVVINTIYFIYVQIYK